MLSLKVIGMNGQWKKLYVPVILLLSGEPSRNSLNNRAEHVRFYKQNFSLLFDGMELAHFDSADGLLRTLKYEQIKEVKTKMVRPLFKAKRIGA